MKLQVTLYDKNKQYRPISTIVEVESMEYYEKNKRQTQEKAILNICHNRKIGWRELQEQGYTQIKARDYELAKRIELLKKIDNSRKER